MKFLLTILFISIIGGQLLRVPLFDRIGLIPTDILVFIIIGVFIFIKIFRKEKIFSKELLLPTIAFFSWALFSLIFNIAELSLSFSEGFLAFAYYGRYLGYFLLIFVFSDQLKKEGVNYWKYLLFLSALALAVLGFLQLKYFPSFYDLRMQEIGWDPHIGRLLSTWFDPNFLGGYFAFILSLLGGHLWGQWKNEKTNLIFFILSGIFLFILIALFLTYSRSSYLALLIAGLVFALFAERRLFIVGIFGIILLLSFSPRAQERVSNALISAQALFTQTERTLDPTSRLRIKSWQVGWNILKNNPITGVGFNNLKTVQKREWSFLTKSHAGSGIDSSILTVMATTGVVGLFSFLWIWGIIGVKSIRNFIKHKDGFSIGFFAGLMGIFIHSFFVNTLFFNLFLPVLFLSSAIIIKENF